MSYNKHFVKEIICTVTQRSYYPEYKQIVFHSVDMDLNRILLYRVECIDVGVKCGGCGHIEMELRIED